MATSDSRRQPLLLGPYKGALEGGLAPYTFKALRQQIEPETRKRVELMLPSMPMVETCRASDFDCFRPFIAAGKLTEQQMHHAADRYHLGKTRSGQPIYWMIDDMLSPLDAHIGDGWISTLLKKREPILDFWQVTHCLFGLHLTVDQSKPIAIVEREEAAVVLSELFPESIWLAYATNAHLQPGLLALLEGRTVTIYPRTDPTLSNFIFFEEYVAQVRQLYNIDLHVDTTLEDHATDEQKARCVDILEFLIEGYD